MRLLLDTNILLEVLLDQERAEEARQLLSRRRA
jgi:predicted nucleic acid-binding protein